MIRLIVSEVVVIMIKIKSSVSFCIVSKYAVIELSKLLVIPDNAIVLTITNEIIRKKTSDIFAFQNGLTVSL
ncbi:hypothetical protein YTPLAS21_16130 [Candidatus Nitrosocosmicus sp.]|nr:hypothetical protein YTPLAS21_16130 [Candidatus Nitrosocosmicus sp.]